MAGIIDGKAWVDERIKFLRAALDGGELTESQRVLVETELEHLAAEAQRDKRKLRRWLVWGGRRS